MLIAGRWLAFALAGGAALTTLAASARAWACSGGLRGVEFVHDGADDLAVIPTGAPITIGAIFRDAVTAEERSRYSAALFSGDEQLPGTLEILDLSAPISATWQPMRPAIFIFRPAAPLPPSTELSIEIVRREDESLEDRTVDSRYVLSGGGPAAAGPSLEVTASVALLQVEVIDRVCCEQLTTSCGVAFECSPNQWRWAPSVAMTAKISDEHLAAPWIASLDGEGAIVDRYNPDVYSFYRALSAYTVGPVWTSVAVEVELRPRTGTRCLVAGFTDLRTMQEHREAPFCVDTDRAALPKGKTDAWAWPEDPSTSECLGPWIRESTGTVGGDGCRVSATPPGGAWWSLLMPLLWGRRRDRGAAR